MTSAARAVGLLLLAVIAALGCRDSSGADHVPPAAEFLVAAGDSTYWVRSGASGIRVRSAPLLLTYVDGQFYEVYVVEDGVEYADASFGTARIWSRRLLGTDSLLLFADSTVPQQAAHWKRRHPQERPLVADEDDLPDDPRTVISEQIEVVDVHGPWLTFTHLLDVDTDVGAEHRHAGRRVVVDVRTGRIASLPALFGEAESARLLLSAQDAFVTLLDSVRTTIGERAELARGSLASFRFDASSFAITDVDRRPAVSFMVAGNSIDGEALAMYLPPLTVTAPSWWATVEPTLPTWKSDSSDVRWNRRAYRVVARSSDDGETLALVLQGFPATPRRGMVLDTVDGDAAGLTDWPVATMATPAYQLSPLDAPAVDDVTRGALARAFDLSTGLDGLVQKASYASRRPAAGMHRW